jgi:hypothetical protein
MATLSSGDTLSLNNLATATDNSTKSMGTAAGSTSTPISMSAFAIDSVGTLGASDFTYVVESTSEDYTLAFGNEGGRFDKIKNLKRNFDWSVTKDGGGSSLFTSASYSQAGAGSGSITITAGDMSNAGGALIGATAHTLSVTFADGFNDHATNYNSARTKAVYSVDSYDGNASALCLVADSPIEKADGTIVEIGDLSEGDELKGYSLAGLSEDSDVDFLEWSTDTLGETQKNVRVVNITYSFSNKIYNINNGEVKGTHEHPMLVKDTNDGLYKFKQLLTIEVGDKLLKSVGGSLVEVDVTSIVLESQDIEIVALDVEEQDTYLVNGYVTHNKGGNSHTDLAAPGAPQNIGYDGEAGTIAWQAPSSVGTTGITAYDWRISEDSDFSTSITNGDETEWSATTINLAGQGATLNLGTTYYFRVRAIDQGLAGTYGTLTIETDVP